MINRLSIKHKSILFMILLISILLTTLYFQNRASNENSLKHIELNYKKNFDNYYKYFTKHLVSFYEKQTQLAQNDPQKLKELLKSQPFLKNIETKKADDKSRYCSKIQQNRSFLDMCLEENKIFYKIIVPLKHGNFQEYTLDARVLLKSFQDYDGSNGILLTGDDDISNNIFLNAYKNSEYFKQLIEKCKASKDNSIVEFLSKYYVKKEVKLLDFQGKVVAKAMFYLDITKDKKAFDTLTKKSLLSSVLLFILASIVVYYFFGYLIRRIRKNEDELKRINKNLEFTIENEIKHRLQVQEKATKEKQKSNRLLMQQSKLAMIGEMIGNIAHQWRQPLMQLGAIMMYFDAYNEKGKLTTERLNKKLNEGNSIIEYMSKTIEDFRNYYKPEKQKEVFSIRSSIESALFIVNSALKNANIQVKTSCKEDFKIKSYKNEFSQALLNIIINAKDILIERQIKNSLICIDVTKNEDKIQISIKDNAGGIDPKNIEKIFDPYFTTKHKSQGTGIGLYMSKMIIETNMGGSIDVKNSEDGAEFVITL